MEKLINDFYNKFVFNKYFFMEVQTHAQFIGILLHAKSFVKSGFKDYVRMKFSKVMRITEVVKFNMCYVVFKNYFHSIKYN